MSYKSLSGYSKFSWVSLDTPFEASLLGIKQFEQVLKAEVKCDNDSYIWEVDIWLLEHVAVNPHRSGCLIRRNQGAMLQALHRHNQLASS